LVGSIRDLFSEVGWREQLALRAPANSRCRKGAMSDSSSSSQIAKLAIAEELSCSGCYPAALRAPRTTRASSAAAELRFWR
jgi:hypothetical protein